MEFLVYIQIQKNNIPDFSYDLISYAKKISNGVLISGVIVQNNDFILDDNKKLNLRKYGLDKLYLINSNQNYFDKRQNPYLIIELLKSKNIDFFILTSSTEGREIAPVIASTIKTGLVADCTKLEITDNNLISTRPTFGGKLMASIISKNKPQIATLRKNTFKKEEFNLDNNLIVENLSFEKNDSFYNLKTEILNYKEENECSFYNIENAKIVFAGGMGLKTKENFDKLKLLCKKYNAQIGATRKAVDQGLIEKEYQIGQTGHTTTPELYVAFGISGAIHHIVGMENSKKIIAINLDKNAPIFKNSDCGLIQDCSYVMDELLK